MEYDVFQTVLCYMNDCAKLASIETAVVSIQQHKTKHRSKCLKDVKCNILFALYECSLIANIDPTDIDEISIRR